MGEQVSVGDTSKQELMGDTSKQEPVGDSSKQEPVGDIWESTYNMYFMELEQHFHYQIHLTKAH